jgi:hypothetical protein
MVTWELEILNFTQAAGYATWGSHFQWGFTYNKQEGITVDPSV